MKKVAQRAAQVLHFNSTGLIDRACRMTMLRNYLYRTSSEQAQTQQPAADQGEGSRFGHDSIGLDVTQFETR